MARRIGIYGGTFDPLHEGHVSFALAAQREADLNAVYFLPERSPRSKPDASSYSLRVKELSGTLGQYAHLNLLELPDEAMSTSKTLPELTRIFPETTLVLLVGADVITHMSTWPEVDKLVASCEFAIGMRDGWDVPATIATLHELGIPHSRYTIIRTDQAHISSTAIRSIGKI